MFAQKKGQPVQFVIPKATILIENPIAVTSTSKHQTEAKAFLKFLRTPAAQKIFAQNGYRPVVVSAARGFNFPTRPQLFTIKYVGGWPKVEKKFFDPQHGHHGSLPGVEWRLTPARLPQHPSPGAPLRRDFPLG